MNLKLAELIEGIESAISTVLPLPCTLVEPQWVSQLLPQFDIGVLVGITGGIKGSMTLNGTSNMFSSIGEVMFGMPLEGEMLGSFVGELANMIAGNLSSFIYQRGLVIDISPPTVLMGETQLYGFEKALQIPVQLEELGNFNVSWLLYNREGEWQ